MAFGMKNRFLFLSLCQIVPLNLLEQDHSSLRSDQWTLLSNLIHSFDEHSVVTNVERFVQQHERENRQTYNFELMPTYIDLFRSMMSSIRPLIEANRDFYLLEITNRSTLVRRIVENLSPLVAGLTLWLSSPRPSLPLWNAVRVMYGEDICVRFQHFVEHFRSDVELHKISLIIFAFSTCYASSTCFDSDGDLSNIKEIVAIQNMYAEVIWRYLLYKYTSEQAVIRFMNLIETFLLVLPIVVEMKSHVQDHVRLMDSLVEQSEIALVLDDDERDNNDT